MLNIRKLFKNYAETGSFNEKINLHGFIDENLFLTKTGELGAVLEVRCVDFECLDANTIDTLTKRLETAFKLFDEKFRLYQYVFRRNNPAIPHKLYGNPIVDTAIRNRIEYLEGKADTLFSLSVYYVVLFEGCAPQSNLTATLLQFPHDPRRTARVLLASLSTTTEVLLLDREITRAQVNLHQKLGSFALQVSDFLPVRLLPKDEAFRVVYQTLNFAPLKVDLSHLRTDTFQNAASGKSYIVFEGTVLETVLINRLDGQFSGPVECLLASDIYSHDRQHLLIPAGTRVLGEAKKVEAFGQTRLAVVFHRLIMPDGYSASLDQFKGLDQIGDTGLRDQVNNHYLRIFGVSLAIGALGAVSEAGTSGSLVASGTDLMRQGFAVSTAQSASQILDRFLNVPPTVTIREGHRVKVYLSGDFALPDYSNHQVPSDL
jgi:hypothetical protein